MYNILSSYNTKTSCSASPNIQQHNYNLYWPFKLVINDSMTQNEFWDISRSWSIILYGRILICHKRVANPTKGVSSKAPSYLMNNLYINSKTMTLICNKMDTPPNFSTRGHHMT